MSRFIKLYNIDQLFTHVELGPKIAVKNVLQVYVTTTMIFYIYICHTITMITRTENAMCTEARMWK